jgi:zinc transport system substrate-binding protein
VLLILWAGLGQAAEKRVLTSLYPVHIATLNVTTGVPGVDVVSMAPTGAGCLHDYQLSAEDMGRLSKADVLVMNGLGTEHFLDDAVKRLPALKIINASKGIEPIVVKGEMNPHVWLSIGLHMEQVRRIAEGLAAVDPDHAEMFRKNADAYIGRLRELHEWYMKAFGNGEAKDVVTFHDAFPYLARDYGFSVVAVVERHPGAQPKARELREAVDEIRKRGVKFVFAEPQYPSDSAELIARETGAQVLMLDTAVSGPVRAGAYIEIMARNLETLQKAFAAKNQ